VNDSKTCNGLQCLRKGCHVVFILILGGLVPLRGIDLGSIRTILQSYQKEEPMSETLAGPDPKSIQPILQPALVSGALQSTNSSSIFYTPSKDTIEENWQESEQRTSLEALKNIPIHAQISSLENLDAPFIPIPKTPDGQSWTEPVSGDEGNAVAGGTTQEILQRTSLEALASLPTENHSSWAGNPEAISIPIPDSGDEDFSTGVKRKRKKGKKGSDDSTTPSSTKQYALTITTLRTNLPHLKNVHLKSSRQRVVKVECYDYSDNTVSSRQSFSTHLKRRRGDFYTDEGVSLRYVLQDHPPPAGQLRLLVVEDLSTDLIACLGTLLKISPEVFEEHLVNSGWRNGEYDDDESDTWITRDMVKTYTTLRWFRPVKRKLQRPYSESDFTTLLKARGQAFSWTETVPNKSGRDFGVKHESRPTTNIIRSELDLKTDKEEDPESGDLIGWEEKATIWCRQVEEYKTGTCSSGKPLRY